MGLSIAVFTLADFLQLDEEGATWMRSSVETINRVLQDRGLPTITEPEMRPAHLALESVRGFPYGFLHTLRRIYSRVRENLEITPLRGELSTEDLERNADLSTLLDSHLLCHSDAEGFYAPVDFIDPIFDEALPGGMLGSSHGLLRELQFVAPALGIQLEGNQLTPDAKQRLNTVPSSHPFMREQITWYALYEAATISLRHGTLISFQ